MPDELLVMKKRAVGGQRYALLKKLHVFVINVLKGRKTTKEQFIIAVNSFFDRNYVELPSDPNFTIKADLEPVIGLLTRDEIRTLLLRDPRPYRAAFES